MQKTALKFIWHYLKNFKILIVSAILLAFSARGLIQSALFYMAKVFDWVATNASSPEYWSHMLILFAICSGLSVLGQSLQTLSLYTLSRLIPHLRSIVIKDTFDYVNKQSISYFTNEMTGNISNKFNQLQNGVVDFFFQASNSLMDFAYLFMTMALLSWVNWILGCVVALWSVLMFVFGKYFGTKRAELSRKTSDKQSLSNGAIIDSIANYYEVKSFSNYKFERANLLKSLREWRHTETRELKQKNILMFCMGFISEISAIMFMSLGVVLFYFKLIDLTEFFFCLTTIGRLSGLIFGVNWSVNNLSRVLGQINSALKTLSTEPEIVDSDNAKELNIKKAQISFSDIDFSYDGKTLIFNDFNLNIKSGEKVGIVGSSGSGKSTLIKLIARYFDVSAGEIKINGSNIKNFTQDSLHKHISTIPQDVCLFNRSLKDNIRYGKTDASDEEIIKASKQAFADKFIDKFANKYDTKVGDRGVILSGGERQRIAIARAILKNAPILIFDEATSSLDSESEKYIQQSLKKLMQNKTVIAIAHRLSTLREMDRIIVLEAGKIIEEGTHLGLLRKKGRYAKLFKMQSDGYLRQTSEKP